MVEVSSVVKFVMLSESISMRTRRIWRVDQRIKQPVR